MIELTTPAASVIVALITTTQGIVLAVLGIVASRVNRVKADAAAVRDQVQNDHATNMREEADERHRENAGMLRWLVNEVATIRALVGANTSRITTLEDTLNPKEK